MTDSLFHPFLAALIIDCLCELFPSLPFLRPIPFSLPLLSCFTEDALSPLSSFAQLDGSVVMEGLGYLALYHAFFPLKTNKAAKPNGENFPYSLPQNLAKLTGLMDPFQLVSNYHHDVF